MPNNYKKFGFNPEFYLATRPEKAMGDIKLWDIAEKALEDALKKSKVKFKIKDNLNVFFIDRKLLVKKFKNI